VSRGIALIAFAALCGPALAETPVDPAPLAAAFAAIGCAGNEKDIFPFVGKDGLDVATFAAQFKALGESGHLVSGDNGETFRLTDWGPCE